MTPFTGLELDEIKLASQVLKTSISVCGSARDFVIISDGFLVERKDISSGANQSRASV